MRADWRGNTIWRAILNVKNNFDENTYVYDDDHDLAFMDNKDQFGQTRS